MSSKQPVFSAYRDRFSIFQASQSGQDVSYGYDAEICRPYLFQPHCHADLELNLSLSGAMTCRFGSEKIKIPAGSMAAFWAAIPHFTETKSGPFVWVTIPFSEVLSWDLIGVERFFSGSLIIDPDGLDHASQDMEMFCRWVEELQSGDKELIKIVQLEMQARLRRLLKATVDSQAHCEQLPESVQLMLALASNEAASGITATSIAEATQLNPRWASSLFKQYVGCSIQKHLTRLRLAYAQRLLATTDDDVLRVALDSGFGSLPACYRAFDQYLSCPPGEYRSRIRSGASVPRLL